MDPMDPMDPMDQEDRAIAGDTAASIFRLFAGPVDAPQSPLLLQRESVVPCPSLFVFDVVNALPTHRVHAITQRLAARGGTFTDFADAVLASYLLCLLRHIPMRDWASMVAEPRCRPVPGAMLNLLACAEKLFGDASATAAAVFLTAHHTRPHVRRQIAELLIQERFLHNLPGSDDDPGELCSTRDACTHTSELGCCFITRGKMRWAWAFICAIAEDCGMPVPRPWRWFVRVGGTPRGIQPVGNALRQVNDMLSGACLPSMRDALHRWGDRSGACARPASGMQVCDVAIGCTND